MLALGCAVPHTVFERSDQASVRSTLGHPENGGLGQPLPPFGLPPVL